MKREVLSDESTANVISYLLNTPYGVQFMSKGMEGLVETSLNLGILRIEEDVMKSTYSVRSSVESRKEYLIDKLEALAKTLKGSLELIGDYPGWEYMPDSKLREDAVKVYKEMYGKEPKIEAIHAGLECGLFVGKIGQELDCISIGPDMKWVHTPQEELSISSTKRVWEYLVRLISVK